ncbi:HBL/NHE enterotoxin family protein [Bacillus cereus]|uniref:HBL/NHE enterotoxin family protein n=1 Tax=Bacillus cereus TaxID=1396 RepID=UPI0009AAFB9A|nr:HBL/NHE enterotoxin family protein [Bacillus cereus]PEQ47453.1 hemolytic enterotoxin [Bacillus cereus]
MKKMLITGLLITGVSTSYFAPLNTLADTPPNSQHTNSPNEFNVNRLKDSMVALGARMPVIEGYGLVLLKQPNIEAPAIHGIAVDQQTARKYVQDWLDIHNPKLFSVNQDMMRFGKKFTTYYDKLLELAGQMNENPQAKVAFVKAFNGIQNQMQATFLAMQDVSADLSNYKNELDKDSKQFSTKVGRAIELYKGSNGDIEKLRTQIEKYDDEIQNEITKLLSLPSENLKDLIDIGEQIAQIHIDALNKSINLSDVGLLFTNSGKALNTDVQELNNKITQKRQQKMESIKQLAGIEIQATQMILVDQKLNNFTKLIKQQSQSFDKVVSSWERFNTTVMQVQASLNSDKKIDSNALQTQLNELKKFTDTLNIQTQEYEGKLQK